MFEEKDEIMMVFGCGSLLLVKMGSRAVVFAESSYQRGEQVV